MKAYISFPITGRDRVQCRADALRRKEFLEKATGWSIVNPFDVPSMCWADGKPCNTANCNCYPGGFTPNALPRPREDCPVHGTPEYQKHEAYCALRYDIRALTNCDAIIMCPNWVHSAGAKLELQTALGIGLRVYTFSDHEDGYPSPLLYDMTEGREVIIRGAR